MNYKPLDLILQLVWNQRIVTLIWFFFLQNLENKDKNKLAEFFQPQVFFLKILLVLEK